MSGSLGRRLPSGARFATVGELYDLDQAERERTEYWCPHDAVPWEWAPLDRLLTDGYHLGEASLAHAPSSMVLVVREVPR